MIRIAAFLAILCCASAFSGKKRAECLVFWTVRNLDCATTRGLLEAQIEKWNEDICAEDPDETCWYTGLLESDKADMIESTHITQLIGRPQIEDNMWMHFTEINEGKSCRVAALSRSPPPFLWDRGTNYCNMHNLALGAGLLHESVGFSEYTTRSLCVSMNMPFLKEKICPERNCCLNEYTGWRPGDVDPDLAVPSMKPKIVH